MQQKNNYLVIFSCFIAKLWRSFTAHGRISVKHKNHTKQNLPNVIDKICTNWLFVFCSLMGVENRSANGTFAIFFTSINWWERVSLVWQIIYIGFNDMTYWTKSYWTLDFFSAFLNQFFIWNFIEYWISSLFDKLWNILCTFKCTWMKDTHMLIMSNNIF